MARCGSKNGQQKGTMVTKEIGLHAQSLLSILGSLVNIIFFGEGGGLLGQFMALELFTLKIHSSNRGAQKTPQIASKNLYTFVDSRKFPILNSKLRIMANNKNDHLRHAYLSGCAMDKESDASIQFFNIMGEFFGAVTMGGGVWRHSRSCDSHCTCSSWRGIPCSIHL